MEATAVKASDIIVRQHKNNKMTSYSFLRKQKKQKALAWSAGDEEKFHDALRVFGEDIDFIHQMVFSKETARKRYEDPERYFSERSFVQLRNKYKKDMDDNEKF